MAVILRGRFGSQPRAPGTSGCPSCCQTTSGYVPYLKPSAFEKDKIHGLAKSLDGLGVERLLAQITWGSDSIPVIEKKQESWGKNVPKCTAGAGTPEDSPCPLHEAGPEDQAKIHGASEFLRRFRVDPRGCLPAPSHTAPSCALPALEFTAGLSSKKALQG